ncbi:Methyltransferase domain-containing protein [Stigmatella aurantiaca]|uniref:Methyltransferase domain-containing protein n=1 Tax=Stigmatella aurantiaca TaxID=41 RepID=A0A1H8DIL2_STIAU|nr:class I SAM-dependent methyltransferase [Stigmatella aurantiaca]SEN07090.1 Methyltransferase domain-containing protein [Stigmatella aurantiaca]
MNESPGASGWAAERGEKWRIHLSGMEAMLKPVDEPLIRALQLDAPCRIADIGCGGGETALEILRQAPAGSAVHGFDITPSLIEAARARIPSGERAIAFDVADMGTAVPEAPYHRLSSRFGVMFFQDAPAAFANLARWLAPGGRFAFAVWGPQAGNAWVTSVRDAVAETVDIPPTDPDAPGPFRYARVDTLLHLLAQAGFGGLDAHDWRGRLPIGSGLPPAEAADFALASFSSFSDLLAKAGDAALQAARQSLTARFARHHQDGSVRMDACVHIVTGTRP